MSNVTAWLPKIFSSCFIDNSSGSDKGFSGHLRWIAQAEFLYRLIAIFDSISKWQFFVRNTFILLNRQSWKFNGNNIMWPTAIIDLFVWGWSVDENLLFIIIVVEAVIIFSLRSRREEFLNHIKKLINL